MLALFKILALCLIILPLTSHAYSNYPNNKSTEVAVVQAGSFTDFIKVFKQMSMNLIADGLIKRETKIDNKFIFDQTES